LVLTGQSNLSGEPIMMTPKKQDLIELNTKLQNFVSKLTTIVTNDTSCQTSMATEENIISKPHKKLF
jgi:hypothetical protein